MAMAWFGVVSQPSGQTSTVMKRWSRSGVWPLLLALQLIGCLSGPLLWSSTRLTTGRSRKRRVSWRRPRHLRSRRFHSWEAAVTVTVNPRLNQPLLVTVHMPEGSSSHYGLRSARMALIASGMEATDPVIEWLWVQQGELGERG